MTGKEFARKIFSPIIWLNLLGMALVIVLAFLGLNWWMKSYTRHGEGIDVPNVKGMLISDAKIELGGMELECIITDSTYNESLAPGIVLEQTPGVGSRVKAGRPIYVTISTRNEPTLPIPDRIIENCSMREAEARLRSYGFTVGNPEYRSGQKDWVLGIKCNGRNVTAGERVPVSATIVLVVGNDDMEVDENEQVYDDTNWENEYDSGAASTGGTYQDADPFGEPFSGEEEEIF